MQRGRQHKLCRQTLAIQEDTYIIPNLNPALGINLSPTRVDGYGSIPIPFEKAEQHIPM
jgi:hypothetical protein